MSQASGTAQEVFYIPQKPYNVIGTLIDQLTYPDTSGSEHLDMDAMMEVQRTYAEITRHYFLCARTLCMNFLPFRSFMMQILEKVDLAHLAERKVCPVTATMAAHSQGCS